MKNISYIINGVLAAAIIVLFILFFNSKNNAQQGQTLAFSNSDSTSVLPVAYVNVDSVLLNYNFAKDANDRLMKKLSSTQNTLAQKKRELEAEGQEFNRKLQQNVFISEDRAQQEHTRINKLAAEFEAMAQRLENELATEQLQMTNQITDSIRSCIERYNKDVNYDIIFLNNGHDNIIVSKDKYDITKVIITKLNERYIQKK